jgi:hypothetical protein
LAMFFATFRMSAGSPGGANRYCKPRAQLAPGLPLFLARNHDGNL